MGERGREREEGRERGREGEGERKGEKEGEGKIAHVHLSAPAEKSDTGTLHW